jgi:hypothetical protein
LKPESPAIDAGRFLTYTTEPGEGGDVPVQDASWFCDGFGMVEGDLVQIGRNPPVRIRKIDYDKNVISVERELLWERGDGVSPPYRGKAPDIGAFEFDLDSTYGQDVRCAWRLHRGHATQGGNRGRDD